MNSDLFIHQVNSKPQKQCPTTITTTETWKTQNFQSENQKRTTGKPAPPYVTENNMEAIKTWKKDQGHLQPAYNYYSVISWEKVIKREMRVEAVNAFEIDLSSSLYAPNPNLNVHTTEKLIILQPTLLLFSLVLLSSLCSSLCVCVAAASNTAWRRVLLFLRRNYSFEIIKSLMPSRAVKWNWQFSDTTK